MNIGTGEQWVITFQTKLRELLPNHIISHAPQAPYFKEEHYINDAYMAIHRAVGHTIDFYNVQFYNQGNTRYDSYAELFTNATGFFSGTAVKQIIDRGVPSDKIVIGKPATPADAANTGYVSPQDLGLWGVQGFNQFQWKTGYMFWQYKSDINGTIMKTVYQPLEEAIANNNNTNNNTTNNTTTPNQPVPNKNVKIMKRQDSKDSNHSTNQKGSRTSTPSKAQSGGHNKEARYAAARARIFDTTTSTEQDSSEASAASRSVRTPKPAATAALSLLRT